MRKTALLFGAIAAAINILGWLTMQTLAGPSAEGELPDFDTSEIIGYTAMLLAFSAIFIGVKRYRDRELNGFITFGKAFTLGLYITLVASVIYVLGWMVYYPNFMPDFADQYSEFQLEKLRESGATEAELDVQRTEMNAFIEMYKNPAIMAMITFVEIFPIGLIISLVVGLILKRTNPVEPTNTAAS